MGIRYDDTASGREAVDGREALEDPDVFVDPGVSAITLSAMGTTLHGAGGAGASAAGGDVPCGDAAAIHRGDVDDRVAGARVADADPEPEELTVGVPAAYLDAASKLFGRRLPVLLRYAGILGTEAVVRGLVGPREAPRLWERHLLNCAAVTELIPYGASVTDVGSGAGLPGIVLAVARPDLVVRLVEPLARRTAFLSEVVTSLGLERTTVVRARAEECVGKIPLADVVTARAVAPLDRLVAWCLPLVAMGGRLLAFKGASAADEVKEHRQVLVRLGAGSPVVRRCGVGLVVPPATIVEIVREREASPTPRRRGGRRGR